MPEVEYTDSRGDIALVRGVVLGLRFFLLPGLWFSCPGDDPGEFEAGVAAAAASALFASTCLRAILPRCIA